MITTTSIFFIVSALAIILMFSWKVFEIKVRKIHFLSDLFAKGDAFFRASFEKGYFMYKRYQKISYLFFFEFIPSYVYELLVRMKDYVSKKYYHLAGDEFRGRRVLRNSGSVSFFLQRITEDKSGPQERNV